MPNPEQERNEALYAARRERFNAVLDAHECGAGDWTLECTAAPPAREGAMGALPTERLQTHGAEGNLAKIGRWAVVTRSSRGHGEFVANVVDQAEIESVAAENLGGGWWPVCYYDLDRLAGSEPVPEEGDEVDAGRGTATVTEVDFKDGEPTVSMSDGTWEFAADVLILERVGSEDLRLPVRYDVARVLTSVAFNTVSTDADEHVEHVTR
jgi:hypothetical protein